MRTGLLFLLLAASPSLCLAQKWMDENGKVYYGAPPVGVYVKPVPITGGAASIVGAQERPAAPIPDPYFSPQRPEPPPMDRWERAREMQRKEDEQRETERRAQRELDEAAHEGARVREEARREREGWNREQESYRRELREEQRERMLERSRSK